MTSGHCARWVTATFKLSLRPTILRSGEPFSYEPA
ncbi:hypothetical protein KPSA1_01630 [Pseudomonas syringae pv. actinidiae]|uniref:Uncharacterized protein n=1 Tax=Pseudomonas syringae pv. actinidiae TaxID=103796 RepID=A0A2V0Q6A0_PSESF|nr:hypothetical protein KPSA1_01630 [Pseudomonas syringae pv. actinidiae]GBH19597.1 hypothetical protein KPSA3_05608 [Pseudomonas syringae pv. actinidiae]